MNRTSRSNKQLRDIQIIPDFCSAAAGSVLFKMGGTHILCAASVSDRAPDHALTKGHGWITAEYTLLPYSTSPRTERRPNRPDGRSVEIQRLIGRSLRSVVDLKVLHPYSITVDCDVLCADGGTRTASITGGFIAMKRAVGTLMARKLLSSNPVLAQVAAVSAGVVDDQLLLDLDYSEDSRAAVDMNIVMDNNYRFIEIQGTGEHHPFTSEQLAGLIDLAKDGLGRLFHLQNSY